jgi:hypothetical protein
MTKFAPLALVAAVLLSGVSAASAASQRTYDNATVRSQIDLNSPDGNKAFWDSVERNSR